MTIVIKTVAGPARWDRSLPLVVVKVYRVDPVDWDDEYDYYFCCATCGNCGHMHGTATEAIQDANDHITNHTLPVGELNAFPEEPDRG